MQASNDDKAISGDSIVEVLAEPQNLINAKVSEVDERVRSDRGSASEYFIADMKGYSRGMYHMGIAALDFLKKIAGVEIFSCFRRLLKATQSKR